jgi:chromate transport protein ChrA
MMAKVHRVASETQQISHRYIPHTQAVVATATEIEHLAVLATLVAVLAVAVAVLALETTLPHILVLAVAVLAGTLTQAVAETVLEVETRLK